MTRQFVSTAEQHCKGHMDQNRIEGYEDHGWQSVPSHWHYVTLDKSLDFLVPFSIQLENWVTETRPPRKPDASIRVEPFPDKQIIKALITAALEQK